MDNPNRDVDAILPPFDDAQEHLDAELRYFRRVLDAKRARLRADLLDKDWRGEPWRPELSAWGSRESLLEEYDKASRAASSLRAIIDNRLQRSEPMPLPALARELELTEAEKLTLLMALGIAFDHPRMEHACATVDPEGLEAMSPNVRLIAYVADLDHAETLALFQSVHDGKLAQAGLVRVRVRRGRDVDLIDGLWRDIHATPWLAARALGQCSEVSR